MLPHRSFPALRSTVAAACFVAFFAPVAATGQAATERSWTTRDSVAVRYFVTNLQYPGLLEDDSGKPAIEWSPDRSHFFYVTRQGDLGCDCTTYRLFIYSAQDLRRVLSGGRSPAVGQAPAMRRIDFSSSRSDVWAQGISEARWEDNSTLLLLGVQEGGSRQVYRFNVRSGSLSQLTTDSRDVVSYAVQGASVVYSVINRIPNTDLDVYPALAVDSDQLLQLSGTLKSNFELLASFRGAPANRLTVAQSMLGGPWIDPTGRYALVVLAPVAAKPPAAWEGYELKPSKHFRTIGQFMLIDLERGLIRPALDAPAGKATRVGWQSAPQVLWSRDGQRAILINTALPLDQGSSERKNTPYIVELDVINGKWAVIDELFDAPVPSAAGTQSVSMVTGADWTADYASFRIQRTRWEGSGAPTVSTTMYSRRQATWSAKQVVEPRANPASGQRTSSGLSIVVRQSANEPPMPVASYEGREVSLLEPDPALHGIWRAPVRPVRWQEKDGRTIEGGLMLPRVVSADKPPPLVIQAYFYEPDLFRPDGPQPTAYAAQPLVAAGFAVLAMTIPDVDPDAEWRRQVKGKIRASVAFVERVDAAVAALSEQGLIDSARVGAIGFSRGGFMVNYAITHPGAVQLQAAVVADAYDASYGLYVMDAATSPSGVPDAEFESYYGGSFWENKAAWLQHAPGFNVDRVTTPTLFSLHGEGTNLFALEKLGAFRINRRPFEYWSFGSGEHQLQRPKERFASIEGSVDWMKFWLLDEEDTAPEKSPQYERWRKIRSDWRKLQAEEARASHEPRPVAE